MHFIVNALPYPRIEQLVGDALCRRCRLRLSIKSILLIRTVPKSFFHDEVKRV
jgi:hypothetical protein